MASAFAECVNAEGWGGGGSPAKLCWGLLGAAAGSSKEVVMGVCMKAAGAWGYGGMPRS
jgi:hypothetical protein